jgi:hypothetical protein
VVLLALAEVVVAVAHGEAVVLLIPWSAHHAIMSRSSTTVVGQLLPKLWYVCFEKGLFWKQRMTSSSVMLAMVAHISKKRWM